MGVETFGANELLGLSRGSLIGRGILYEIIRKSKIEGSENWRGLAGIINNTPQQGINWIGPPPRCAGVIVKAASGAYASDGWTDPARTSFRYSFKAKKGAIGLTETANRVLVEQPLYKYPLLLFIERGSDWEYEGYFHVTEIEERYVVIARNIEQPGAEPASEADDGTASGSAEGTRRYVVHLLAERDRRIVCSLKSRHTDICELCGASSLERYGVAYVEAHHKTPISTYTAPRSPQLEDFALLCASCHRAVHILMRRYGHSYAEIEERLRHAWAPKSL